MHYHDCRELSDGRKVHCLRAEKLGPGIKQGSPTTATNSGKRKPSARGGQSNVSGAGGFDARGNFYFEWQNRKTVYFNKEIMEALVNNILGFEHPLDYDLQ